MSVNLQKLCAWGGPAAIVISFAGWLIAGVLPLPLGPSDSAAEVVAFYAGHQTRFMVGIVIATIGVCFTLPLVATITIQMLRMEGRHPVLSFLQLGAGSITTLLNLVPQMMMGVIAFRPERSPELTQTLNDLAWMIFLTGIMPFIFQNVAIGVAVLRDRKHVFPRWVGYLNLWVAFAFVPDVLAYFFYSGPFAWNGVLVFWLALTAYCVFLAGMCVAVRRAAVDAPRPERSGALAAA
jgi:hypothetical protein